MHQDVTNVPICVSTIRRLVEFQHGLALNHTNLVQSQMVGFDLWPSNFKQRWLAKKLGSSLRVTSWYVSFSMASYENATVPNGIVLVNSKQTERHSERWRHLWFHESEITHEICIALSHKETTKLQAYLFASQSIYIDVSMSTLL